MKCVQLTPAWIEGAVSVEICPDGIKPWRIPYEDYELFPPDGINGKAEITAGVRVRMFTNATNITLTFKPIVEAASIDCCESDQLIHTVQLEQGASAAAWLNLSSEARIVELWLPQNIGMTLHSIYVSEDAWVESAEDQRPVWITYGSSITQCVAASSPALTWPSIVARSTNVCLMNLGFSGNCQLEPMIASMIRDLKADCISLALGINVYGAVTMSSRILCPAIIGLIKTIREKHVTTPIVVISPIYATTRERAPNQLELTVSYIRDEVAAVVEMYNNRGDSNLFYRDGRALIGEADATLLSDGLHPTAEGYVLMAERLLKLR